MHIPDGVLDPAVLVAAGAVSVGALAWAGGTMRRSASPPRVALAVAAGGGVMVAHLFDVTLVGGQTAHLLGGMLLAIVLGPRLGLVTMAAVLALEAVLLGDGGVAALGVNVLVMGVVGVFGGWAVYRWALALALARVAVPLAGAAGAAGAAVAAVAAVGAVGALASVAASAAALWLVGAGTPSLHFLAWGALEAALTGALVAVGVGVRAALRARRTARHLARHPGRVRPDPGAHAA